MLDAKLGTGDSRVTFSATFPGEAKDSTGFHLIPQGRGLG